MKRLFENMGYRTEIAFDSESGEFVAAKAEFPPPFGPAEPELQAKAGSKPQKRSTVRAA